MSKFGMRVAWLPMFTALLIIGCAGKADGVDAVHPTLPAGVHLLTPDDMYRWCNMVDPAGKPVDPEGMCQDFRTVPSDVIASFEARLPSLLAARGRAIDRYVRQYWAVFHSGRLYVVGKFICHSITESLLPDDEMHFPEDPESSPASVADTPVVIDDAGACKITVSFAADRPEAVQF